MKYLFELSKEQKTLPKAEILSYLNAEKISYKIAESNDDILIIELDSEYNFIKELAGRLSFTFFIDRFLFSSKFSEEMEKKASNNPIRDEGSIAIKYKNRSETIDSYDLVKTLAEVYSKGRMVSLDKPDIEVRMLITDSKTYVGVKIAEIKRSQFEKRKVQHRPFFSPISLHPKLARAIVNLSGVKKDETLLDPFCGTGGILIEAGLVGAKIIGSDVEKKMIRGCEKNLEFYNIKNHKLFCSDIGEINKFIKTVDAVVTDLPYGRSTTTKGEKIECLYSRTFENLSKILKKDGKAVFGLSSRELIHLGEQYFTFLEEHKFRMHRNLARYFVVFQN
ncbi:MAG: methyltransferase domain-containing protein [Thermoplasmatales archaeon]|nr:MAG: methyltransferase domain-containing protein [Thermoplasmatales archaeon]